MGYSWRTVIRKWLSSRLPLRSHERCVLFGWPADMLATQSETDWFSRWQELGTLFELSKWQLMYLWKKFDRWSIWGNRYPGWHQLFVPPFTKQTASKPLIQSTSACQRRLQAFLKSALGSLIFRLWKRIYSAFHQEEARFCFKKFSGVLHGERTPVDKCKTLAFDQQFDSALAVAQCAQLVLLSFN